MGEMSLFCPILAQILQNLVTKLTRKGFTHIDTRSIQK